MDSNFQPPSYSQKPATQPAFGYQHLGSTNDTTNVTVINSQPAPTTVVHYDAKPENYLGLSIFNLLCCCWVFGIIALVHSLQVDSSWNVGDREGSRRASNTAKNWNVAGIITGVVILVAAGIIIGISAAIGRESRDDDDGDEHDRDR